VRARNALDLPAHPPSHIPNETQHLPTDNQPSASFIPSSTATPVHLLHQLLHLLSSQTQRSRHLILAALILLFYLAISGLVIDDGVISEVEGVSELVEEGKSVYRRVEIEEGFLEGEGRGRQEEGLELGEEDGVVLSVRERRSRRVG
jgi:hypothetical protein